MKNKQKARENPMLLYETYDRYVSGGLNGTSAWDLINTIEETFPVDDIKLQDGTRLWNLLRVFLYTFHYELIDLRQFRLLNILRLIPYHPKIIKKEVVDEVLEYVCCRTGHDQDIVSIMLYDYIKVFVLLKWYYKKRYNNREQVVLPGCGYGRSSMAQAQACRELSISCVEHQHGVIDRFFPAYMRATPTMNHDCLPGSLVVFDEDTKKLVGTGGLFQEENITVVGNHPWVPVVLFTGQWILSDLTVKFLNDVISRGPGFNIWFHPHSLDRVDYSKRFPEKIVLVDKDKSFFDVLRCCDVHATVFSGRGMYSYQAGIPTVFVDLCGLCDGFPRTPDEFIKEVDALLKDT